MEVSSGSGSHLGHSHGGSASNISINPIGGSMGGPNDGKIFTTKRGRGGYSFCHPLNEIY